MFFARLEIGAGLTMRSSVADDGKVFHLAEIPARRCDVK